MLLGVDASRGTATGPDGGDLLRPPDVARHAARADRAGVVVQGPAPDCPDPHRLGVFGDLRRVIGAGESRVDHQPEASSTDGRVRGVEALVRWEHPQRGLLVLHASIRSRSRRARPTHRPTPSWSRCWSTAAPAG